MSVSIPALAWTIPNELPFRFSGNINNLTVKLGPSQLSATDQRAAAEALAKAHD
jgi:hypothetical protein